MDKSVYNSLTNQLIQNGIISNENLPNESDTVNFFEVNTENNANQEENNNLKASFKKRLNSFDNEAVGVQNSIKAENSKLSNKEKFFIRFFPKLYKAYLAKNALKELTELDINTDELLNKSIPYGEEESRYKNLIKYLKYANDIQVRIKKKFN